VSDVSRETDPVDGASDVVIEAEPPAAAILAGDWIGVLRRFADNLGRFGEERGLIGPLEPPRLWSRHILNSAIMAPLLRPGRVGDIGTGAGLPGLVLAIIRPDVHFVLIEPMERRVAWLEEQSAELGLDNVTILRARAEDVRLDQPLDQVTARAVSALRTLLPLTAPLLRDGGELVLMKGASVEAEIAAAEKQLRRFQVSDVRVDILGEGLLDDVTRVVRGFVRAPAA
jgi:16S rRNA (guanine527-N7)-methyltransferase